MKTIPLKMRATLEQLPRMKRCTLSSVQDLYGPCAGRLMNPEWHHPWEYGGKGQINEIWAIVAGCSRHHEMVKQDRAVKSAFEASSLVLATEEDLAKYPRKNWAQICKFLGISYPQSN